jgi:hypothetical protein
VQLIGQVVYPPGLPSLHRVRVHAMAAMALARARGRRARSDGVVWSMYVMYASELHSPMSLMRSGGTPMRWAKVAPPRRKLCPENSDGFTPILVSQPGRAAPPAAAPPAAALPAAAPPAAAPLLLPPCRTPCCTPALLLTILLLLLRGWSQQDKFKGVFLRGVSARP